jgi:hypothetical protein
MTLMKEHVLTGLSDATLSNGGQDIAFTLRTKEGPLVRLQFAMDEIPGFIAHLCSVVALVHPQSRQEGTCCMLPALAVGLQLHSTDTAQFVFALRGLNLGVEVQTTQAAELAAALAGMAETLRASGAAGPLQ